MPDLYPKFDMPDLVEEVEDTSIAYPKSWLFDFDTGDFVLDGAGNVVEADGLTTWAQWCVKAVLTQRLAFVVYNWDYGVDIENVMKQPTRAVTEAELEKEITEALMTDPRTAEVKNFTFEWSGDELTVSFIIVNAAGVPAEIRVGVGYREVMREFSISKVEQTISDWLRGELVNVEPTEDGELVIKSVAQPTFTRNSIAYKSDGSQVAVNVPRFEAGKFGQGIMIEEGTTNLFPTNLALSFSSAWTRGALNGTYTVSIKSGTGSLVLSGGASGTVNVGSSLTFTVSKATVTFTPSGGTPAYCQLEQKAYATSWTVGTRRPEELVIPTAGVIKQNEGSIEVWFYYKPNGIYQRLVSFVGSKIGGYKDLQFDITNLGTVRFQPYRTDSSMISVASSVVLNEGWHYAVCTWNNSEIKVVVDNQAPVKKAYGGGIAALDTYFTIGKEHKSDMAFLNSIIDEVRISNRVRTDAEILSAYQSNQPLPIDENTTYALRFDNNLKVGRGGYRRNKIYLQSPGICQGSRIEWSAEIPTNTTAKVYTSLDDVNFTEAVNGAAIEGLSEGVSLSDKALTIKQIMTTEDASITPKFNRLQYSIDGKVSLGG